MILNITFKNKLIFCHQIKLIRKCEFDLLIIQFKIPSALQKALIRNILIIIKIIIRPITS